LVTAVGLAVSLLFCCTAVGAEQQPKAEEKPLEQLVGRWDITAEGKVLAPQAKSLNVVGIVEVGWVLDHAFQQSSGTFTGNDKSVQTGNVQMTRWDAAARTYRRWTFDSGGGALEWTGTWDEQAKTFAWHSQRKGVRYDQTYRIQTPDAHQYEMLVRDADEKVIAELRAKVSRHK
jgi:hypothetical protein